MWQICSQLGESSCIHEYLYTIPRESITQRMADTSCTTECFTRSKSYGHGGTMKLVSVNKDKKLFTFKIKQPSWRELLLLALFFSKECFFLLCAEVEQSNMYGNVLTITIKLSHLTHFQQKFLTMKG